MITMHAHPRQTDGRTNIMAIARRFVCADTSRAKNFEWPSLELRYGSVGHMLCVTTSPAFHFGGGGCHRYAKGVEGVVWERTFYDSITLPTLSTEGFICRGFISLLRKCWIFFTEILHFGAVSYTVEQTLSLHTQV